MSFEPRPLPRSLLPAQQGRERFCLGLLQLRTQGSLAPSQKAVFPRGAELQCFSAAQGYLLLKLSEDERWELLSSTQLLHMEWRLCPGCGTLKILGPIYSWPTLSLGEGGSSPERQTEKTSGCMSSLPTSTKGSEILPEGRSSP